MLKNISFYGGFLLLVIIANHLYWGEQPIERADYNSIELSEGVLGDYSVFGVTDESPIVIYTVGWCEACIELKHYFNSNNVEYLDYDIEEDEHARKTFDNLKNKALPVIIIDDMFYQGFNKVVIEKKLNFLDIRT